MSNKNRSKYKEIRRSKFRVLVHPEQGERFNSGEVNRYF